MKILKILIAMFLLLGSVEAQTPPTRFIAAFPEGAAVRDGTTGNILYVIPSDAYINLTMDKPPQQYVLSQRAFLLYPDNTDFIIFSDSFD